MLLSNDELAPSSANRFAGGAIAENARRGGGSARRAVGAFPLPRAGYREPALILSVAVVVVVEVGGARWPLRAGLRRRLAGASCGAGKRLKPPAGAGDDPASGA
jgi:hypothetical protein